MYCTWRAGLKVEPVRRDEAAAVQVDPGFDVAGDEACLAGAGANEAGADEV
ncbi:MAG: hypothetical protein WD848_04200 [Dehalococcoidia bacterium]